MNKMSNSNLTSIRRALKNVEAGLDNVEAGLEIACEDIIYVNITFDEQNEAHVDKTYQEIKEAFNAGSYIIAKDNRGFYQMNGSFEDDYGVSFSNISPLPLTSDGSYDSNNKITRVVSVFISGNNEVSWSYNLYEGIDITVAPD